MHMQAESTYIAHNMFGQIKIKRLWYSSRHSLNNRKRDGKPRMIGGQFVAVRVGVTNSASLKKKKRKNYAGSETTPHIN